MTVINMSMRAVVRATLAGALAAAAATATLTMRALPLAAQSPRP